MKPLITWSESAGLTSMVTQRSPTGLAVSLNFLPSVEIWSAIDGSATTATASCPSTQRAEATLDRSDNASPKKRHRMKAPTTTTTATSAAMTPTLTPRRPVVMARWLPVHSPPSHSPECCARDGTAAVSGKRRTTGIRLRAREARHPGTPARGIPARNRRRNPSRTPSRDRSPEIQVPRSRARSAAVAGSRARRRPGRRSPGRLVGSPGTQSLRTAGPAAAAETIRSHRWSPRGDRLRIPLGRECCAYPLLRLRPLRLAIIAGRSPARRSLSAVRNLRVSRCCGRNWRL